MGDELKPCPFCGTPARYVEDSDHHGAWFNLGCGSEVPDQGEPCPAHYAFYTCDMSERDAAITAWNTRAQGPGPGEAVAYRSRQRDFAKSGKPGPWNYWDGTEVVPTSDNVYEAEALGVIAAWNYRAPDGGEAVHARPLSAASAEPNPTKEA